MFSCRLKIELLFGSDSRTFASDGLETSFDGLDRAPVELTFKECYRLKKFCSLNQFCGLNLILPRVTSHALEEEETSLLIEDSVWGPKS